MVELLWGSGGRLRVRLLFECSDIWLSVLVASAAVTFRCRVLGRFTPPCRRPERVAYSHIFTLRPLVHRLPRPLFVLVCAIWGGGIRPVKGESSRSHVFTERLCFV